MTGAEMIECGQLMESQQAGVILPPSQLMRLAELKRRAKVELPHDDPTTPGIDEGETEIQRASRIEVEWMQRLANVEQVLLKILETLGTQLGAVAIGALQTEVNQLLKR